MNAAPLCRTAASISGTSCSLSPENAAGDERRAHLQREHHHVDRLVAVHRAALRLRALVRRRRELALGEAVDAVVLDDVDHVDAAPQHVHELADADRRRIAVAGNAEIDEIAVGEIGAGQHRRHAAMHAVEAVRIAEEIGRRLRRAADPRQLGDAMRLDVEVVERLDDRRRDRIVAAARAQRRDRALVVAARVAELVARQVRDGAASVWRDRSFESSSSARVLMTPPCASASH